MSPSNPRLFSEDWTITVPSYPTLKFVRTTPPQRENYFSFIKNPINTRHIHGPDFTWDEESIAAVKQRLVDRYAKARTKHSTIELLVYLDDQVIGVGGVVEISPQLANIGIALAPEAQGRGIGKITMQVLLRLSNEVDLEVIEAGTMKHNKAMRGLAVSLGLEETDEEKVFPDRGVVADVMFLNIPVQKWKDYEINIDFKGPAAEEGE